MIITFFFNASLVDKIDFVTSLFSEVGSEQSQLFFNLFSGVQLMSATYLVIWVMLNGV